MLIESVDQTGIDFLTVQEGVRLRAYLCSAGRWTIGIGMTYYPKTGIRVQKGDVITRKQADEMFRLVLKVYEEGVLNATRDDITQNQFNALVSFTYNVGVGNLMSSTLLKKVNKNPWDASIRIEFPKWQYADGKPNKGLLARRLREIELYFS